jgi:NitT/TauT family transport system substrate-binding protein
MRNARVRLAGVVFATVIAMAAGYATAAGPVKIAVGYQTWYSQTTTAIIIRELELWKQFLPKGTEVEFQASIQGPVIINNMLAGKAQIGYLGDMPAIVATTKEKVADIRIVGTSGVSSGQICHLLLVSADAPKFASYRDAVKWLDGKTVAAPKGGCTDLFFRHVMKTENIKPKEYQHQGVETIITNFRAKKLDAAVIPEFPATRIVAEGTARLVATGHAYNLPDAGLIVMRKDFIDSHPEVAKAWMKMEMHVQQEYMLNPTKWRQVSEMAARQNPGYTAEQTFQSNFALIPADQGGGPVRQVFPFAIDDVLRTKIVDGYKFLSEIKVIGVETPRDGAIDDALARKVAAEGNVKLPLGEIRGEPSKSARSY